jgi:hypothetical protein
MSTETAQSTVCRAATSTGPCTCERYERRSDTSVWPTCKCGHTKHIHSKTQEATS